MKPATAASFSRGVSSVARRPRGSPQQQRPALAEELVQHLRPWSRSSGRRGRRRPPPRRRRRRRGRCGSPGGRRRGSRRRGSRGACRRRRLGHQGAPSGRGLGDRRAAAPASARASGRRRGGGCASEGRLARISSWIGEVEVGGDEALGVGRLRQDHAPGVDDHRAAVALVVRRRLADLVRRR